MAVLPHVCEICDEEFDTERALLEHECPNEFDTVDDLLDSDLVTDGGEDDSVRTVVVDEELEGAVDWVRKEIREARSALWDGQSGRAFAAIEAAQDQFETVEEAVLDD